LQHRGIFINFANVPKVARIENGMLLKEFIYLAGGVHNILRVLLSQNKTALCIKKTKLVMDLPDDVQLEHVLDEEHLISESVQTNKKELMALGREIDNDCRMNISEYLIPEPSPYRPGWHISPPVGLINDPNGFIFHGGKYRLCYQWYPYNCLHKDKYWVQMSSSDLVNWTWDSIALTPSDWFDSHGVFSGHAISIDDKIMVFYTGNTRIGEKRIRQTTQCAAISTDAVHYEKIGPLISCPPKGVTEHIRDPKIVHHHDMWWMFLGAQTDDLKGRLAVYKSHDLYNWEYDSLYGEELGDFGYMWECPDIFDIDGQYYFSFSPQGIESESSLNTLPHHNRIAPLNFTKDGGIELGHPVIMDHGFDFYASQSAITPDGRRVIIGWMGLPEEIDQPSCEQGWVHQFTLTRELTINNGKLIQTPCEELVSLRGSLLDFDENTGDFDLQTKQFELNVTLKKGGEIQLFANEEYACVIRFDEEQNRLLLDRSRTLQRQGDFLRELALCGDEVELHIFADNSSIEIFVNGGEGVMTARVFTPASATRLILRQNVLKAYGYHLLGAQLPFANH